MLKSGAISASAFRKERCKTSGRKREAITLAKKVEIIRQLESGRNQSDVSNEYVVAKSTIATIWKKRDRILCAYKHNLGNIKRLRRPKRDDIDDALIKWVTMQRRCQGAVTGPILQAKAKAFAKFFDDGEFSCTLGWLSRFKKRYNITSSNTNRIDGGKISDEARNWLQNVWPEVRKDYSDADIFAAGETGLFYKLMPEEIVKFQDEKCEHGKYAKDRLTVLVCANMVGSERRKLVVIGKWQEPKSFLNCKQLPVTYRANKKAWMSNDIFIEELVLWDLELQCQKRKILLLVDEYPCHPLFEHLDCITLVYLPQETNSTLRPMHQGVVRSLKSQFRKALILHIIDSKKRNMKIHISVLDAIRTLDKSWWRVMQNTIQNSFYRAGFLSEEVPNDEEDDIPLSVWLRKYKLDEFISCDDIDDYIFVDEDVIIGEMPEPKLELPSPKLELQTSNSDTDDAELDRCEETPAIDVSDAMQAIRTVSLFFEAQNADQELLDSIAKIDSAIEKIFFSKQRQ